MNGEYTSKILFPFGEGRYNGLRDMHNRIIEEWSGKSFELPYDKMIMLFNKAKENRPYKYKNLEDYTGNKKRKELNQCIFPLHCDFGN